MQVYLAIVFFRGGEDGLHCRSYAGIKLMVGYATL